MQKYLTVLVRAQAKSLVESAKTQIEDLIVSTIPKWNYGVGRYFTISATALNVKLERCLCLYYELQRLPAGDVRADWIG